MYLVVVTTLAYSGGIMFSLFLLSFVSYRDSLPLALNSFLFFFNDTAPTEIYTLSLHDALPICYENGVCLFGGLGSFYTANEHIPDTWELRPFQGASATWPRSEEHTSELQSHHEIVCRLLLEKKNTNRPNVILHQRHQRVRRRSGR